MILIVTESCVYTDSTEPIQCNLPVVIVGPHHHNAVILAWAFHQHDLKMLKFTLIIAHRHLNGINGFKEAKDQVEFGILVAEKFPDLAGTLAKRRNT